MGVLNGRANQVMFWVLALLHAAFFALALPPFDVWFLVFIAPAPLALMAMQAPSAARAVIIAFVAQFVMWLWLLRWIIPVTPIGYPSLALYMSIWGGVFAWLMHRVSRHRVMGRWPMTLVLPVIWTGVEFFRGDVLFHGYPWYLLGHPLIEWPVLVQSADLFGTYFISFLAAMVSGALVDAWRVWVVKRQAVVGFASLYPPYAMLGAVAVIWLVNTGYGWWRMNQTDSLSPGPRILAIQTNLPLDIKVRWSEQDQEGDLRAFSELTRSAFAAADAKPDVIVWPETMVPGTGFEKQTIEKLHQMYEEHGWDLSYLYEYSQMLVELQRELGVPMLVGSEAWIDTQEVIEGRRIRLEPGRTYNSAYLVMGEPPFQRYDKYFLTPFGETMPYISAWPWLEQKLLDIGVSADMAFNLDSNPEIAILELPAESSNGRGVRLGTPICFEDTVARFCRRMVHLRGEKGVDVLVNISNDGWFNRSNSDRILHAMISRFRAIENRVPMVRSVNTGMSLWIDSAGRVKARVGEGRYGEPMTPGWVVADVQIDSRRTLYSRVSEAWPIACLALSILGAAWTLRRGGGPSA